MAASADAESPKSTFVKGVFPIVNVDISNIWCSVSLPDLLTLEQSVSSAHAALMDAGGASFLSWLDDDFAEPLGRLSETADKIREQAAYLVVVGDGSAVLGARAALELLRGRDHALSDGVRVLFTGSDLSTHAQKRLDALLNQNDFYVHAVGRDGMSLQSASALRALRWTLERRYGAEGARERLIITTDPSKGALRRLAVQEGLSSFNLPRTLAGHDSVLAPGALLCLLAAGVDVKAILSGAAAARKDMEVRSFENPAWLYAAARTILAKRGKRIEFLCAAEPDAWTLCRWWRDLFGSRACWKGKGLIPAAAELPGDLQQIYGPLSDGKLPLMQTILRFAPPSQRRQVSMDLFDFDNLNCLNGYTLDFLQEQVIAGTLQAGQDGGVPMVTMDFRRLDEGVLGELLYFFELSSCLCAGMLKRNLYAEEPPAPFAEAAGQLLGRLSPEIKR